MNWFQIELLYLVGATVTVTVLCVTCGIALLQAGAKRLRYIQVWLLPIFVGNFLNIPAVLLQDYHFFTGTRTAKPEYLLILTLPLAAGVLFIYGMARLVRIIHDTPAAETEDSAGIQPDPSNEGPWPPPPDRPTR